MSILPSHKSKFDKRLDEFFGVKLEGLDLSAISTLADSCPAEILPILAFSFDIDIDGLSEPEARAVIKDAFSIHRLSGTVWAVRAAVRAISPNALIIEGNLSQKYSGAFSHNGARRYGSNSHWAEYSVITALPIDSKKAAQIRAAAKMTAPVRCTLAAIDNMNAAPVYNGEIYYNKNHNYGVY